MMSLIPTVWMQLKIRLVQIFCMLIPKQDCTLNYIFDLTWYPITSNGHFTPKLIHSSLQRIISLKMKLYFANMLLQNEHLGDNFTPPP